MRLRHLYQAVIGLGAVLALTGGAATAILRWVDPASPILARFENGCRPLVLGFLAAAALAVASALVEALAGRAPARPAPAPPQPAPPPAPAAAEPARPAAPGLSELYHEVKTYVDLEMWELALEKANLILKGHPGTPEADLVAKIVNEIRWKAEPKFAQPGAPAGPDREKELREKGLAEMYQHVRTYMDLEMWELARQKALAIMNNFPDAPETAELARALETIEKKARESVAAEKDEG